MQPFPTTKSALLLLIFVSSASFYCRPKAPALPDISYTASKAAVNQRRQALKAAYKAGQITLDSVRQAFTSALLNDIIPYWYGTGWSFEGHTTTPRQGKIACGYFVSTTLLDVGLHLNRYRLAQQAPEAEAKMLSFGNPVTKLTSNSRNEAATVLGNHLREGLYFVGLDNNHVGYLLKRNKQLTAIHSNYTYPAEVMAQPFLESVYAGFETFYVAEITWNDQLIKYWLNGKEIPLMAK